MLGGYKLVSGLRAQVFDVVDKEGVGEGMLGEEDELGAAGGEAFGYFSTNTRCTSLNTFLAFCG